MSIRIRADRVTQLGGVHAARFWQEFERVFVTQRNTLVVLDGRVDPQAARRILDAPMVDRPQLLSALFNADEPCPDFLSSSRDGNGSRRFVFSEYLLFLDDFLRAVKGPTTDRLFRVRGGPARALGIKSGGEMLVGMRRFTNPRYGDYDRFVLHDEDFAPRCGRPFGF